jgi:hypothetical protein
MKSARRSLLWHSLASLLAGLLAASLAGRAVLAQQGAEHLGVVSLRVTHQPVDAATPWNKRTEQTLRGNALVVGGGLLLTTADLVKNATLIEVRKLGRYPDFQALRVLVDYELDLALLSVADPDFWDGLVPLRLSTDPITYGRFIISRWRSNGRFEQGSGEVVDLRATTSRFGSMEMPVMRATTIMAGLGWAEAMTYEGEVVGLITSHNNNEIQATMSPVLAQFVEAAGHKPYQGFAHRGFGWQLLNQPALRAFHGLDEDTPGVLITRIFSGGTGSHLLRVGDILMQLGPYRIDPEGMIAHPLYGSMLFPLAINDGTEPTLPATVLRDGRTLKLGLRRERLGREDYRIRTYAYDAPIDYLVFGGLVLQELTLNYLQAWGDEWQERAPRRLVIEYAMRAIREAGSEPEHEVIVSRVLPDSSNLGYQNLDSAIVTRVNDRAVRSLADFREALRHALGGFHVIELLPGQARQKVVFEAASVAEANRRINERYDVPEPPQLSFDSR